VWPSGIQPIGVILLPAPIIMTPIQSGSINGMPSARPKDMPASYYFTRGTPDDYALARIKFDS
jgi:hypothetical protein